MVISGPSLVPVMRPRLPCLDAVADRLRSVERSGWYTNFGPQERELRLRFAEFLGVSDDRVATASSATLGLQGAVAASPASLWTVPSFTFPATPAAVLQAGAELCFGDITPQDWWLDPTISETADEAAGLIPVAPFGAPIELERWDSSREVIIDAAASLGARMPDLNRLPATWAVVFSLHATKCLPAGEGGLVVFGNPARAEWFRAWSNFGLQDSRDAQMVPTNAKLSELASVYAHASLDAWPRIRSEWEDARHRTDHLEREHELVGQPGPRPDVSPFWVVVLPDRAATVAVERAMLRHGVDTRRWWSDGCHRMPAFEGHRRAALPVTESTTVRALGLPMFRGLDTEHTTRISAALAEARSPGGR